MIKVTVMYPNQPGVRFDMTYYCSKHVPMVRQLLGTALLSVAVEEGIAGMTPDAPATYVALGHMGFESVDAFTTALAPHAAQIFADIPKYTNSQPIIQVSQVKI